MKRHSLLLVPLLVMLVSNGCKSLDKVPFQSFAEAGDRMSQGTKEAYAATQSIVRDRQKKDLIHRDGPPWVETNRAVLLQPYLLDPKAVALRLKLSEGLSAYARKLANIADGPDYERFDASVHAAAGSLAGFDANALSALHLSPSVFPSQNQANEAANLVSSIGKLLLEQATKRKLEQFISANATNIDKFTSMLAADVGFAEDDQGRPTEGLRGFYGRELFRVLQQQAGNTEEWKTADETRRGEIVDKSMDLLAQIGTQDAALVALRDSYRQFAVVNRQLIACVKASESFSAAQAIQVLSALATQVSDFSRTLR